MSADCALASVLTRSWIFEISILASSISMAYPRSGARRSSVRTPVDAMNVLVGTQSPATAQAPPTPSQSTMVMSATSRPRAAATSAAS